MEDWKKIGVGGVVGEGGWNFKKREGGKGRDPGEIGRWELREKGLRIGG